MTNVVVQEDWRFGRSGAPVEDPGALPGRPRSIPEGRARHESRRILGRPGPDRRQGAHTREPTRASPRSRLGACGRDPPGDTEEGGQSDDHAPDGADETVVCVNEGPDVG
jgi:hypothetical protein